MSRSFKKHPHIKDHPRGMKAIANRRFRRHVNRGQLDDYPTNLHEYKYHTDQYDVSDYTFRPDGPIDKSNPDSRHFAQK